MLARLTAIVFLTGLLSCTNVGLTTAQAADPDPLLKAAESIYQKAKGKYKTVGVLKIQVQKGTGEAAKRRFHARAH